jgi:hypothetical protein
MKRSIALLAALITSALACQPSQRAIETAMAQTQAAMPTQTPIPSATPTPPPTATRTRTPTSTPRPIPTQRPITIEEITATLRRSGFVRYDSFVDPDSGWHGVRFYAEGIFIIGWMQEDNRGFHNIQVLFLNDPDAYVRREYADRGIAALSGILSDEALDQLAAHNQTYNEAPYGELNEQITLDGALAYYVDIYTYQETSTCPPEYQYCYYVTWPTITFTGTASLTFYIISVSPGE